MELIIHVDMNSYFARLEAQREPNLQGKPICVTGKPSHLKFRCEGENIQTQRTVCAAFSEEAKKYGLKSGDPVWIARKKCPQILIIEADYPYYQATSQKIFEILLSFTPWVEIFSIDEGFLQLRGENQKDLYQEALQIAQLIKQKIREEIGDYLTCSIGIAPNKLLAKMASESKKPDGLTIIFPEQIEKFIGVCKLEDFPGIGPRVFKRLQKLGIKNIFELQRISYTLLEAEFGKSSAQFLAHLRWGKDASEFVPIHKTPKEKSFGHSYTLPSDIYNPQELLPWLLLLSERTTRRMRKKGFLGKTIRIVLRFKDFSEFQKQTTIQKPIDDGLAIYKVAKQLLISKSLTQPVRLVGVSVSNLTNLAQISLFDEDIRAQKISQILDLLNQRFGDYKLFRSSLKRVLSDFHLMRDWRGKRVLEAG